MPVRGELAQQRGERLGLRLVLPDAGSSSSSTCGCVAERAAELDEPGLAGRQRVDARRRRRRRARPAR